MSQACACCGKEAGYIACPPPERRPVKTFADLISNCVCWACYVTVIYPVDKKLANAKARLAKGIPTGLVGWDAMRTATRAYLKDAHNVEAWERAIESRGVQRQLYGVAQGQ